MQRTCAYLCLLAALALWPLAAHAKTGPTVYTAARQAAAYQNAAFDWSLSSSHVGYTQPWLALSLGRIHELVPHPSLPRASHVSNAAHCPNGKPRRRWYVDPNIRFKVKCMDTDDAAPDLWYPQNDFEAHYLRNRSAAGEYVYPATDTTFCNPANPAHDCGYGAVVDGARWYFVAHYVHYTLSAMGRLDLGDPLNGRSLFWSGSLASLFLGGAQGREAALRVAVALHGFAEHFVANKTWYKTHIARDPNLVDFVDSQRGVILGRMADGLIVMNAIRAYDLVFAAFDDPELLAALDAAHPGTAHTGAAARAAVEDGLFWPAAAELTAAAGQIWGNATLPHDLLLHIAFTLDAGPRSQALIDWTFGEGQGRLPEIFVSSIDRDGGCDEVSATYCSVWYTSMLDLGELLALFQDGALAVENAYTLPVAALGHFERRIGLMFSWARQLETMPGHYVHLGDEGATNTAGLPPRPSLEQLTRAFHRFGRDPQLAAQAFQDNGDSSAGLHTSIWDADPFAVQAEIDQAMQTAPMQRRQEVNLAGFGFAQLRQTAPSPGVVWGYFGRNLFPNGSFGHHGHHDQLDWGIQYAGVDFMPTPGYPSAFGWRYFGWEANTPSHNAVMVDRTMQSRKVWASDVKTFLDTAGSPVQVMDLESRTAYPGGYEWPTAMPSAVLKRRLVKIPLGGGPFVVVELAVTRGGAVHHYSYHGGGPAATTNVKLTAGTGTYAAVDSGQNVAYEAPYDFDEVDAACRANRSCVEANAYLYRGSGFQFLANAAHTSNVPLVSSFTWNQYDWQTGAILSGAQLRGYVIRLAGIDQLALATGTMPKGQPVRYVVVRGANGSTGSALLNVWEPVSGASQVKTVTLLGSTITAGNVAAAIDIRLHDGRVFVVGLDEAGEAPRLYGKLGYTGKVAVYAEQAAPKPRKKGTPATTKIYAYLAEGSALAWNGAAQIAGATPAVTGTIASVFAGEFESRITVPETPGAGVVDRWVDVVNATQDPYTLWRDATFRIYGVAGGELNLDGVPLIGRHLDTNDYDAGLRLLANPGDGYRIALDTWN